MSNLKKLQESFEHEDNNPLEIIKVKYKEKDWQTQKMKIHKSSIPNYVNIYYCCFNTGWGAKDPGTLEEREKNIMDSLDDISSCVLIFAKYNTLEKFKAGFKREMHWINQNQIRITRWGKISKMMFDKIRENASKTHLEKYVEENFNSLIKMLPANPHKIELDRMDRYQLLEELSAGRITTKEADTLIAAYEKKITELNADKLCMFSGSGRDPDRPSGICSRTGDPKKRGNCSTCRVAAEWEECHG